MDWRRGLLAAATFGIVGAVAPLLLMLGLTAGGWLLSGASEFDRWYDLAWLKDRMPDPMMGIGALFAASGWATFAPRGPHRFTPTFVAVTLTSLAAWFVLGHMQLTPRRLKGVEHPVFYPSELFVLFGPPVVAAAQLSLRRACRPARPSPAGGEPAL